MGRGMYIYLYILYRLNTDVKTTRLNPTISWPFNRHAKYYMTNKKSTQTVYSNDNIFWYQEFIRLGTPRRSRNVSHLEQTDQIDHDPR